MGVVLTAGGRDRFELAPTVVGGTRFGLPEYGDDLFFSVSPACHNEPSFFFYYRKTLIILGLVYGGKVR